MAELSQLANALARARGDKSQVNVAVNAENAGVIVVTEAKSKELQAKLKAIQDAVNSEKQSPAPATPLSSQTQLVAKVGADSNANGAPAAVQAPLRPSLRALGFDLALPESPNLRTFLEAEPVREEHRGRDCVGW